MNKTKLIAALAVSMLLALSLTACGDKNAKAGEGKKEQPTAESGVKENKDAELKIGDKVSGFVVKSIDDMPEVQGQGIMFEHEKSGASLFYMANKAENRGFEISFKTPALNDKGLPHVLEHTLVCGSDKYPDPNLFAPISSGSYNTFMNATTSNNHTNYPLSSLSEKQLMTLMDFYLSGVFQPILKTEPNLYNREAWRYELNSKDEPIRLSGTVYNEMRGRMNIDLAEQVNLAKASFDGGKANYQPGGDPLVIPEMTLDELLEFHEAYYHPSNSLIQLYGDLEYKKFLAAIDEEYLSKYDKKDIKVEKGTVEPYTETKTFEFEYPASKGAKVESNISYNFVFDELEAPDYMRLQILAYLLSSDSTEFKQKLQGEFPNNVVQIYTLNNLPEPMMVFALSGANKADKDKFVKTVDKLLAQHVTKGFDKAVLDNFAFENELNTDLMFSDGEYGQTLMSQNAVYWAEFDVANSAKVQTEAFEDIGQEKLNELTKKWLIDNKYRSVAVTTTKPGLAEENQAKVEKKLAEYKASLSDEELDALIKQSKDLVAWSVKPADSKLLAQILTLSPKDLEVKKTEFAIDEEEIDGVKCLSSNVGVEKVSKNQIFIDINNIPVDKLHDVALYTKLIKQLPTTNYSKEKVASLNARYLSMADITSEYLTGVDKEHDQYLLQLQWTCLNSDYKTSVEYMKELVFETKVDDIESIKGYLDNQLYTMKAAINENPGYELSRLGHAVYSDLKAVDNYTKGVAFYNYLADMRTLCDTNSAEVTKRLKEAKDILLNKHNAVASIVGGKKNIELFKAEMPKFFADMKDEKREDVDYSSLMLSFKAEGLVNETDVHTNHIALDGLSKEELGGNAPVIARLINDMCLLPELTNARGAYDTWIYAGDGNITILTGQDPNIKETYEYFKLVPQFLREADFTQENVDGYIMSTFQLVSKWKHPFVTYPARHLELLRGLTIDDYIKQLEEIKSTTVEDVRNSADVYDKVIKEGVKTSSGRKNALEKSGLFESFVEYK